MPNEDDFASGFDRFLMKNDTIFCPLFLNHILHELKWYFQVEIDILSLM